MSTYYVQVVETTVTTYRVGGVDTEDQAMTLAEEDSEERNVGRQVAQYSERSSRIVDPVTGL